MLTSHSQEGGLAPALSDKSIWIDLDNSPHVHLFVPVITHYRKRGVEVILTARDHSQTIQLLDLAGLHGTYSVVGKHYGKNKLNKIRGVFARAIELGIFIKRSGTNIRVALSHGSRSMILAAVGLKIPVITMYDYEFTETFFFNRMSDLILVPDLLSGRPGSQIGLRKRKLMRYPGIKEELYIRAFRPNPGFREQFLKEYSSEHALGKTLVILRPPASSANYHAEKSDLLFDHVLHFLLHADVLTVVVPRTADQADEIERCVADVPDAGDHCIVLREAVDGLNLVFAADLVISGGGTMNREAALLGIPVYSIFAGRQGALDVRMEKDGLITFVRTPADVDKIELKKRRRTDAGDPEKALTDRVERFVINEIDSFLERSRSSL